MNTPFIDEIKEYYYANTDKLSNEKRFHFASRLAAWNSDPRAQQMLETSVNFLLPDTETNAGKDTLSRLLQMSQDGEQNAQELRLPFFNKYPDLYGLELAIFRVRHLKYIYGIDLTNDLLSLYPKKRILELKQAILNDDDAIKYLSTFAINFCYLTDIVILNQRPDFSIERIYELGNSYNMADSDEIQLLLYLYTHCIICETNFYIEHIPPANLNIYRKMLVRAEQVIADNFDNITLDNKLEFLVAARICQVDTKLQDVIYTECRSSVSAEGNFIIDTHNTKIRQERQTFDKSEHRNALLIMSDSIFAPINTIATKRI
jgi:hypothetical protein